MDVKYSKYFVLSNATYRSTETLEYKLVYNTLNGSIVRIPVADANYIEKKVIPQNTEVYELLTRLNIIVAADKDELATIVARNKKAIDRQQNLSFIILPTTYCNMGCGYCGQSHTKGGMNDDLAGKVVARVSQAIGNAKNVRQLSITWFGGEPMVAYHQILKIGSQLVDLAEKNDIKYYSHTATNASLLTCDKILQLSKIAKLKKYYITFDGPPAIHDKRRVLLNGKQNFARTIDVITQALNHPELQDIEYVFRTNIDKENQEYIEEYLYLMKEQGFDNARVQFHLIPVYSWSNDVSDRELQKNLYAQKEIDWFILMTQLGLQFPLLDTTPTEILCTALNQQAEVINSDGKIFSCTEHPLVKMYDNDFIGVISEQRAAKRNKGQYDDFNDEILKGELPCSKCTFLGVCGGSCPKQWAEGNIPCPSYKYNIQERLDLLAVTNGLYII